MGLRPYSFLHAHAFFFLSLNILGKQQSRIWGTQDRTKHQKQAGNTAYKTCLATFPNTLAGIKQRKQQNCSVCYQPHIPTRKTSADRAPILTIMVTPFQQGSSAVWRLIQKSASYYLQRLKQLQPPWAMIFNFATSWNTMRWHKDSAAK